MNPEPAGLRRASAEDLDAIARIQSACPEAASWKAGDYLAYDCWVAVCGEWVAGFAVARRLADGESELLNLAVDPAWRRRGIGRRLVAALLGNYGGTLWLEVRESNVVALKFYTALGFQEAGRRSTYYSDCNEGAIVMNVHS